MKRSNKLNHRFFGIGTIGRDAVYTMISMYLMFYMTDVLQVDKGTLTYIIAVITGTKIFDAVNDPFMGVIVDNTKSKYGKFKPWILGGALVSSIFTILMFTDFKLTGPAFVVIFLISYLLWEISFTANDIAYWSMLPALSQDQKEREKIGATARICANIGMFAMVIFITPITSFLGDLFGSLQLGYFVLAIIAVFLMLLFQIIMLIFVKEDRTHAEKQEHTRFRELFQVIFKNDQLLWIIIAMALFMIGYTTTTSFGQYYFKYVYGDINQYATFAMILGIAQISSLLLFPKVSKHFKRKQVYLFATILMISGYVVFFFAPNTSMIFIAIAGLLMFIGQAAIQLLMLMFISDTVEYGELKLGRRNDSVTLSLQSFVNKIGSAVASAIVGITYIQSGMEKADTAADVTSQGLFIFKFSMLILPVILVIIAFILYHKKYIINEEVYAEILEKLNEQNKLEDKKA